MSKEAKARIRINELLSKGQGGGFSMTRRVRPTCNLKLTSNSRKRPLTTSARILRKPNGFVDYLLLDDGRFPLAVLEAKSEKYDPLVGKEQARKYAQSQNVRFVILSNGNLHYFWDLEQGNPTLITEFPTADSLGHFQTFKPNPETLINEKVETDYIAVTQNPNYQNDPRWTEPIQKDSFIKDSGLKFLRPYQLRAIVAFRKRSKRANSVPFRDGNRNGQDVDRGRGHQVVFQNGQCQAGFVPG